jgi:hypothetical protein
LEGQRIHPACISEWAEKQSAKASAKKQKEARARAKVERVETRKRREAIKTIAEHKADAQYWFRRYIRFRDRDLPCVSCGIENPPMKPGGQWDAGHFLGRGAYPELAFDEDNCHKQCKKCNAGGGKFAHKERTVNEKYEVELLNRIGPERLARLKGPHPVAKRTREELNALEATYKAKCKELEKQE